MKAWLKSLDAYWFGHGSPVTMGVIRIFIGFWALTNFLMIAPDFNAWFTEKGYVPFDAAMRKFPNLSDRSSVLWYEVALPFEVPRVSLVNYFGLGTSAPWMLAVYVLTVLAALTTMLGLWTRLSTILLAIGVVTIHHRNGFIVHGGDTVLRVMVLYLALAPCGLSCSLDRVIGLWKGRIQPGVPMVSLWAQRLIAYNIALVYFTTFWHKMRGNLWRDGTATWYPARLNEFDRFWVPPFLEQPPFIYVTTYGTLATELALGTLVFYKPLRKWVLLGGLMMHAYIEYSMNIPLFAFVICSCYVAFYSGEEVTAWFGRLGERFRRRQVRVWTPAGKSMSPGPAAAIQAMDPLNLVAYNNGTAEDWEAKTLDDQPISPVKASWARSLGAWTVGWIPGVWKRIMDRSLTDAPVPNGATTPVPTSKKKKKAGAR